MATPLKYLYDDAFFEQFATVVGKVLSDFSKVQFLRDIHADDWAEKELKERMRHIAVTLNHHIGKDYKASTDSIIRMVERLKSEAEEMSFLYMFLADYIEVYGLDDFNTSVNAMEEITQFTSCEFAVRPFIIKYPQKMLSQMKRWAKHPHAMVRRLASEGCRPRLPWAMALPSYKADPEPILPILEQLKNDPSESVRRSVANNLNDISKDHPGVVINLAKAWVGQNKETDWVVKHACRGLLKAGHPEALLLFGFAKPKDIKVEEFYVHTPKVKIGASLAFSFTIINQSKNASKLRLEYGIYFQKANGSLSRKVFKISERVLPANTTYTVERKQPFRVMTTRKLYPGLHQVSVIINGKEYEKIDFELISS